MGELFQNKTNNKLAIFLTNSKTQKEDAKCISAQITKGICCQLLSVQQQVRHINFLGRKGKSRSRTINEDVSGLFFRLNQLYQILVIRWKLGLYVRQFQKVVLILGDDICPVERSIIAYANKMQIPTLLVMDGQIYDEKIEMQHINTFRTQDALIRLARWVLQTSNLLPPATIFGTGGCKRIAAWGEYMHEMLVKRSIPPEIIEITGSPRFDKWFTMF